MRFPLERKPLERMPLPGEAVERYWPAIDQWIPAVVLGYAHMSATKVLNRLGRISDLKILTEQPCSMSDFLYVRDHYCDSGHFPTQANFRRAIGQMSMWEGLA